MIKNLWKQTTFCCGCHEDSRVPMVYNDGGSTMFYSCPKYYNHEPGEKACANRLSFDHAEQILEKLSDAIASADFADFNGYKISHRGIDAVVEKYNDTECIISIVNRRALA